MSSILDVVYSISDNDLAPAPLPGDPSMDASFEEKSVWIQLTSLVLALAGYGYVAWQLLAQGIETMPAYAAVLGAAVVAVVIINVVGHVVAALTGGTDQPDERDRIIEWRAESRSGWLLAAGVVLSIGGLAVGIRPVWIANALLLSLFLAEMLRLVLQLVDYRRGL